MRSKLLALAFVASCAPAHAQPVPTCGEHNAMIAALAARYGETPAFFGLAGGMIVTLTLNEATGDWTLLTVEPTGRTCMVAAGESGRVNVPPAPVEEG